MTTVIMSVVIVVVLCGLVVSYERLSAVADGRPKQPMSQDSCRVCDKPLRHGDIWELREHSDVDELAGMGGGTFMAITYCRRHRPTGSIRT